jgi:hypothetical protein
MAGCGLTIPRFFYARHGLFNRFSLSSAFALIFRQSPLEVALTMRVCPMLTGGRISHAPKVIHSPISTYTLYVLLSK